MTLRPASVDDQGALESFDLGETDSLWLRGVSGIVAGLVAWQQDRRRVGLDRRVIVAESDGQIVAVLAHERLEQGV
ncbi:MAG: hypothetical protein ACR2HQ_04150, partial [Ilumatobacteraceae bacterium]